MSDISSLKQSFKGDIVTPADPNYKDAIARWAANAERPARIVAFVKDPTDVSLALRFARDNNLQVAIRCGGHSTSGASSAKDGLVIDLSRYFNYAVADPDARTVRVGGGAIWDTVEKESIKYNLATVAGTVSHTGVSGLLLGGGYGFLTGEHGLAVDNLLQATLITADGTTLTLSDTENADLFWGIRGGGCNFGIVVYPAEVLSEFMTVLSRWLENAKKNEGMHMILHKNPSSGKFCITLVLFYNGSEEEGRENYKEFYALKPIFDGAKEIPFEELNTFNNAHTPGTNYYIKGAFLSKPTFSVVKNILEKLAKLSAAPGNEIEHGYMFELASKHAILSRGEDATAHVREHRYITGGMINWMDNTPSVAQAAKSAAHELADIVAKAEGTEANIGYGNFSSENELETVGPARLFDDSKARALFGRNYPRLQRLKAQYDPDNVFFRWFPIVPDPNAVL